MCITGRTYYRPGGLQRIWFSSYIYAVQFSSLKWFALQDYMESFLNTLPFMPSGSGGSRSCWQCKALRNLQKRLWIRGESGKSWVGCVEWENGKKVVGSSRCRLPCHDRSVAASPPIRSNSRAVNWTKRLQPQCSGFLLHSHFSPTAMWVSTGASLAWFRQMSFSTLEIVRNFWGCFFIFIK